MYIQQKFDELDAFLTKWKQELCDGLGVPNLPGASIGVSFQPEFQMQAMPSKEVVAEGFYVSRGLGTNIKVEVTQFNASIGMVVFEMLDDRKGRTSLPADVFVQLFQPAP